jgi:predicted anti-sigma-YlaC factor YlaD
MHSDRHDAMRQIIDRSLAGEASAQEQHTLNEHLRDCAVCRQYAEDGRRALAGLGGFSFAADSALEAKVMAALTVRARQLEAAELSHGRIVRICLAALLLTILGSLFAWNLGTPLATALHLQPGKAQTGVLALWLVPSWAFALLFPIVLLLAGRSARQKGSVL